MAVFKSTRYPRLTLHLPVAGRVSFAPEQVQLQGCTADPGAHQDHYDGHYSAMGASSERLHAYSTLDSYGLLTVTDPADVTAMQNRATNRPELEITQVS